MKDARSSAEVLPSDVPVYRNATAARTAHSSRAPFKKSPAHASRDCITTPPTKGLNVWGVFKDALVGCTAYRNQWVILTRAPLSTA